MKRKVCYWILLLAGLLLPGSASVYAQSLRGVVTEAETGQPIVGAPSY